MHDMEKVIKGLACCAKWMDEDDFDACNSCPYHPHFSFDDHGCLTELNYDAIALLKEQEAKRGKWIPVTNGRGGMECSICHDYAPNFSNGSERLSLYCPNCGAKMKVVKWE